MKKCRKRLLGTNDPIKSPTWANVWPKISVFGINYKQFKLKIQPKVGHLKPKTILKNFLNNFEKFQQTSFLSHKIVKNYPSKSPKWANFGNKSPFSVFMYRPLGLKINPKVGLLTMKTMPKQLQNNFEKVQNTTFSTTKMAKTLMLT